MGHSYSLAEIQKADNDIQTLIGLKMGGNSLSENDLNILNLPSYLGVLVTGAQHSGKSSTINTILRILNEDWKVNYGLHKKYAEVTARGGYHGTSRHEVFTPKKGIFRFYDCPGIVVNNSSSYPDYVQKCLTEGLTAGGLTTRDGTMIKNISASGGEWNKSGNMCSSVILVICKDDVTDNTYRNLLKNTELMEKWRAEDRLPFVVLTGKKEFLNWKTESQIKDEISDLTGVSSFYWLENSENYKDRPCESCATSEYCSFCSRVRNLENEWQVYLLLNAIYDSAQQRFKAKLSEIN